LPYQIVMRVGPSNGSGFTCFTFVGCVGPDGRGPNDGGLACAYTTVGTNGTGPGVNPAILCRLALQYHESVEDVVGVVENNSIYYGCNLVAADHSGVAAVIERTYSNINVRWSFDHEPMYVDGESVLAAPSHFVSGKMNQFGPSMPQYLPPTTSISGCASFYTGTRGG